MRLLLYVCWMTLLVFMLLSCSPLPATHVPAPYPPSVDVDRVSRMAQVNANDCSSPCPDSMDRCHDAYGLCFTPCAYDALSQEERNVLDAYAQAKDPRKTWLIECNVPEGAVSI
jgi:hypothetical protein